MVSATTVESGFEPNALRKVFNVFFYGLFKEGQSKGGLLLKKQADICITNSSHDPANPSASVSSHNKKNTCKSALSSNRI